MAEAAEHEQRTVQLRGGGALKYPQERWLRPRSGIPAEDPSCLGAVLGHGEGQPHPTLACPTGGNAWGCPQGGARGLKTARGKGQLPLT